MKWSKIHDLIMGGTTGLGISPDSKYILAVSHNGRGLFDITTGERVARDYEEFGNWNRDSEVDGIGKCEGIAFQVSGLHSETPEIVMNEIEAFDIHNQVTEFRGASISPDSQYLAIGYSDVIEVYGHVEQATGNNAIN